MTNAQSQDLEILSEFSGEEGELVPMLHRVQKHYGYLPEKSIRHISGMLRISESKIYGVASFFPQFRFIEPGKCSIKVCMGTACHVCGAQHILDEFERSLKIKPGQVTEDKLFSLETVNCLGACALGPVAVVDGEYHGQMRIKSVEEIVGKYRYQHQIESDTAE